MSASKDRASSCEIIWVLGGGHFGQRAVQLLRKTKPTVRFVVVDRQPLQNMPNEVETICADGAEWFFKNFTTDAKVNRIIPALPIHVAADWLTKMLSKESRNVHPIEIPDESLSHFPNPIRFSPSQIVSSHADFLCPPNCSEQGDLCTYTKKQRATAMHHILETVNTGNFVPCIIKSRQFASGVGGFFPEDLWRLFEQARQLPATPLLIGTACKCHGIIDGLYHSSS